MKEIEILVHNVFKSCVINFSIKMKLLVILFIIKIFARIHIFKSKISQPIDMQFGFVDIPLSLHLATFWRLTFSPSPSPYRLSHHGLELCCTENLCRQTFLANVAYNIFAISLTIAQQISSTKIFSVTKDRLGYPNAW